MKEFCRDVYLSFYGILCFTLVHAQNDVSMHCGWLSPPFIQNGPDFFTGSLADDKEFPTLKVPFFAVPDNGLTL